ncbi:unnamed protein product, partial [Iphiclides podalirius]
MAGWGGANAPYALLHIPTPRDAPHTRTRLSVATFRMFSHTGGGAVAPVCLRGERVRAGMNARADAHTADTSPTRAPRASPSTHNVTA